MYLERLYIKNYKSIEELDLSFSKGTNIIIGRNNSGKSNIISAINLLLGENSPTYAKSNNIVDDDFYSCKSSDGDIHTADDIFILCELKRDEGESLNYDEMYKCFGFYECLEENWIGDKQILLPARFSKEFLHTAYKDIFELNEDKSKKIYINPKKRNEYVLEHHFGDMHHFAFALRASKDDYNIITKDIRFLYREDASKNWRLAFRAPIRNELIQSAIIPAFRDPQYQLRLTNWTWFGKLMKHLTDKHNDSDELREAFDGMKIATDKIFKNIKENIGTSAIDVAFPGTELHFQFNADKNKDLYKNCMIYVDDGFKSQLTEKGSGIQSATIIGLFNYYTRCVNTVTSALLCIEEPELYLHPHARRVIARRLDDFLDDYKNQVIISTHGVDFIRTVSDTNIILVNKRKEGSKATQVKTKDFRHLLINNNQNELFFADKVIVCEGYDEYILKFVANEIFPKKLDEQNVSIVSAAGKNNINELVDLVLKLGIKCFIFADFDYLLRDEGDERKVYAAKAHRNITNISKDFFNQDCIFGVDGPSKFKKLQSVRSKIKANYETEFYTAKTVSSITHSGLPELLKNLRQNGIGILSGEIEHCSTDDSFLSPENKLNLKKIYNLNAFLADGFKIADHLDTSEIEEFLKVVFKR